MIKHISAFFDPLRDELGTVPTELHTSKYVTASMLGICAGYAKQLDITSTNKIALITDAVFEEIFDALEDDQDLLEILFPITIILSNFDEITRRPR